MNSRIAQIRMDALTAEYIYTRKLDQLAMLSIAINILTIILPILLTSALLIAKGTSYQGVFDAVSIVVGAVLLSLVVVSLIFGIEQKRENYIIGRRSNIFIASESLKSMDKKEEELVWFYNYTVEIDARDLENIGEMNDKLRKEAYRKSLMKLIPGSSEAVCSMCKASPFRYEKGTCQLCGNTGKD